MRNQTISAKNTAPDFPDISGCTRSQGGGLHDLRMDRGLPPGLQKATPLLITELPTVTVIPSFRVNFDRKLPVFDNFLPIS